MSKRNNEDKNDSLQIFNEFYKFRTKLEFETLKTFHMKFKFLNKDGSVNQEACQKALKGGMTAEVIQREVDKEKYFIDRIRDRRTYFDYYLRRTSFALSCFNAYPTNLYMHFKRRAYLEEFKSGIKCILSELVNLKKQYPGVDLDAYESDIKQAKYLLKMADGLKPYDNNKLEKAKKEFFESSDKQDVKKLYLEFKNDDPINVLIQEETPL